VVLSISFSTLSLWAQSGNNDAAYTTELRKAMELFKQNKHMEALPILEDLLYERV
jgi:hypothetical protein